MKAEIYVNNASLEIFSLLLQTMKALFRILIWVHSLCMYKRESATCTTHSCTKPCLAYPETGLFDLFFQPEQCFPLTTIQPEQCFQSVSAKFQQAERKIDLMI